MLATKPADLSAPRNSAQAYCEPRSEWKMQPGVGRRLPTAMVNAAATSDTSMVEPIDQPTIRRENRSMMTAR